MKFLIVDDNSEKLRRLISVLELAGVERASIDTSRSAWDALNRLRGTSYDVVVLDLLLPARDEDEAQLKTSLELLRQIADRDDIRKPRHLVGFTAYADAEMQARPHFQQLLWTIVQFDPTSTAWEEQFRRVVAYLRKSVETPRRRVYEVDLCLVTALQEPELAAIYDLPWHWEPAEPMDDATFVRLGRFRSGNSEYSVVAACAARMGNVAAALLSAKLIDRFSPRFLVMAGICAGIKMKVNLGDPVSFSPCWEWASGKVVPDEGAGSYLEPAPHQIAVPEFILSRMEQLKGDSKTWLDIRDRYPHKHDSLPKLIVAPAASGPSILAHTNYTESIRLQHRKLSAIDMEAYGVMAAAASASAPKPTAFVLKSVCDFADEQKDDRWQSFAAYTSAQSVRMFFERHMSEIRDLAGT